ncbi:hypothetical protein ES703_97612 [subsurface metagenome]
MTKEFYKNPLFYYVAVPVITAGWMLLVWTVRLPQAQRRWDMSRAEYTKAQEIMTEILNINPDRLDYIGSRETDSEFDYAIAVEKIASLCRIPSVDYKLSSGPTITSGGQRSQRAKMVLRQVDITRFADFLTTIQFRWAGLRCTQLKLTHKKGLKDKWDVDLDFAYYY